jgi:hypothetical protein
MPMPLDGTECTPLLHPSFDLFDDVYLFENQLVCKLNWTKRPSEELSFSVRRLLSITFHINIQFLKIVNDLLYIGYQNFRKIGI